MRRATRAAAMALAGALGTGAAIAAAAGDGDVKACVVKRSGELQALATGGKCGRGEFAITIGGNAFKKSSRGGTLTINGVAFKRSGRTLTINGTSFRTGTLPRTLTINGTSFQTGTLPKSLTINGNSFHSDGQTLTINGTSFEPGSAAKPGPAGPPGPPGPPGTLAGPPPAENAGPVEVKAGAGQIVLVGGASFSAGETRRVLVTGGFTASCAGCSGAAVEGTWELQQDGRTVARRSIGTLEGSESAGPTLSEIVVTKGTCSPCEFRLVASVATGVGGGGQIDVRDVRLGVVDAGAVSG